MEGKNNDSTVAIDSATTTANAGSSEGMLMLAPSSDLHASTAASTMGLPTADQDVPAPKEQDKRTKMQVVIVLASLGSALFLSALDVSIVSTMVPTMTAEFGSAQGYTWVGGAYTLAYAAGAPVWGKVSDIFGRKPVLLLAVADFWVGSLLCGSAHAMGMLVAGRAVQGLGGGGIVVLVNICLGDLFSPRDRALYLGGMGLVWGLAGGVGPLVGGVLATHASWRWVFYINLPVAGLAFAVLLLTLDLHNPRTPLRAGLAAVDWLGSATVVSGTVMLLLGLELGGVVRPWSSPTVVCLMVAGVVFLVLFAFVERRLPRYPILPRGLLRRRSNLAVLGVCFFHGMTFIGAVYYLPLYFQAVLAASPMMSGVYFLPYTLANSVSSIATGLVVRRIGRFLPSIVGGLACMALGTALVASLFGPTASWTRIVLLQILAGAGAGANFQPPLLALQAGVATSDMAAATAAFGFVRQLATSSSVVLGGVVFQNAMQRQHPAVEAALGADLADLLAGGSAAASIGRVAGLQGPEGDVARATYWFGLRDMFIMYAALAGTALAAGLFVSQKRLSEDHEEVKTGLQALVPAKGQTVAESCGEKAGKARR